MTVIWKCKRERERERERETTYSERMKYLISNLKEMIVKLISLCGGGTESDLYDKYSTLHLIFT